MLNFIKCRMFDKGPRNVCQQGRHLILIIYSYEKPFHVIYLYFIFFFVKTDLFRDRNDITLIVIQFHR